jgi:hypothetical protein
VIGYLAVLGWHRQSVVDRSSVVWYAVLLAALALLAGLLRQPVWGAVGITASVTVICSIDAATDPNTVGANLWPVGALMVVLAAGIGTAALAFAADVGRARWLSRRWLVSPPGEETAVVGSPPPVEVAGEGAVPRVSTPPSSETSRPALPRYPPPPSGYAYPLAAGWNGFAIAGFLCAFLCGLIGIVFCVVALRQIKKRNQRGRGLAVAGLVISLASIALFVVAQLPAPAPV